MQCKGCDYENIPARGGFVAIRVVIAHFKGNKINWKNSLKMQYCFPAETVGAEADQYFSR